MHACPENAALLPLAPGEIIDDLERQRLESHLAGCAGCRASRSLHEALRNATALAGTRHAAPAALAARITDALHQQARPAVASARSEGNAQLPARSWLLFAGGWLVSGALACAVALLVFLGPLPGFGTRGAGALALAGTIDACIENHARALVTNHVLDVVSSDRHTVKPWFRGRLDFSPTVVDLADRGFPLIGARLEYVQNRSLAVLVYQRRQHLIDVYVWPDAAHAAMPPSDFAGTRGFHAVQGSQGGALFVAVSDLDPAELHALATALAAPVGL